MKNIFISFRVFSFAIFCILMVSQTVKSRPIPEGFEMFQIGEQYQPEMSNEVYSLSQTIFNSLSNGSSLDLEVYFVPYVGDIDGSIDTEWYAFYDRLRQWHDANSMPGSCSFYPGTMGNDSFDQIVADMHFSENIDLILKGEDQFEGVPIDVMDYNDIVDVLEYWQDVIIYELEDLGYSNVELPTTYNQLMQDFNETIRDAAYAVGFNMYFEHGVDLDKYGYIDMLPDFDITQYSVPLTTSGAPGPDEIFKQPEVIIQDVLDFDDERLLYVNGIKVVPLLCHQQDFRMSEESSVVDENKWSIYTSLLTIARDDPRITVLGPEEVYRLRHSYLRLSDLTDFESIDHGWTTSGIGQSDFEIGVPTIFDPNDESCLTDCFGTGPPEDHTEFGTNAACTNLDGYMAPSADELTNSLVSPVYNFSGCYDVSIEFWRFIEIEGLDFDYCLFEYKDDLAGEWQPFDIIGEGTESADDDHWSRYAKNLSSIADGKSYFQVRFYCITDGWYEGSGLCLDDITFSWTVASDINLDKKVDLNDYMELATAWMSEPNQPAYNEDCDIFDDDIINELDLDLFVQDWLVE
jgi:hypothetical protein